MRISTSPIANHIFVMGEMEKMSVLKILKPKDLPSIMVERYLEAY